MQDKPERMIRTFTPAEMKHIKSAMMPRATLAQVVMFCQQCARSGLDPFCSEIYPKEVDGAYKAIPTIEGLRKTAEDTGTYAGQEGPEWCGADGVWANVWLSDEPPMASRVGIYRVGSDRPVWGVSYWKDRAVVDASGDPVGFWRQSEIMLAKCAEAAGLRKACPGRLGGLYIEEEVAKSEPPEEPLAQIDMPAHGEEAEGPASYALTTPPAEWLRQLKGHVPPPMFQAAMVPVAEAFGPLEHAADKIAWVSGVAGNLVAADNEKRHELGCDLITVSLSPFTDDVAQILLDINWNAGYCDDC